MHNRYTNFVKELQKCLTDVKEDYSNFVILCIGTDEVIGDSIGPTIGSRLKRMENDYFKIYGELKKTLDFFNAKEVINSVYKNYEKPYIVTIDAALSNSNRVGDIILNKGYMKIGKALERSICFYSNININCIVGRNFGTKESNLKELIKADEKSILEMSELVSLGIKKVLEEVYV